MGSGFQILVLDLDSSALVLVLVPPLLVLSLDCLHLVLILDSPALVLVLVPPPLVLALDCFHLVLIVDSPALVLSQVPPPLVLGLDCLRLVRRSPCFGSLSRFFIPISLEAKVNQFRSAC